MGNFEMLCAIAMSLIVMIVGLLRVNERWELEKNGVKTIGHIVRIDKVIYRNRVSFVPTISFNTFDGKQNNVKLSDSIIFKVLVVNDPIQIIYDPKDSENIVVDSKIMAIFDIFITIVGLSSLLFFLLMFIQ